MPAITADTLTLPRLSPLPVETGRTVTSLTTAPRGFEGEGFPVHRAFAGVPLDKLDPFIHMDQMGEVEYAAGEPKGTPWHPHRGFETFTYLIDGEFIHQDSNGGGGTMLSGGLGRGLPLSLAWGAVAWLALGYRCSKHRSTGFSPYELLCGSSWQYHPLMMSGSCSAAR